MTATTAGTAARHTRLGIVDNDRLVLQALAGGLTRALGGGFAVLWAVSEGLEALDRCSREGSAPDLLLVDVSMEDISGIRVCRAIRHDDPRMPLLAMTSFTLESYAPQVAAAGAQGIVAKDDVRGIARAVRAVADGGLWNAELACGADVPFASPGEAYLRLRAERNHELSVRETQIVDRCARGWPYARTASALGIGEATVRTYVERACRKLGAANRQQLIALWLDERRRE